MVRINHRTLSIIVCLAAGAAFPHTSQAADSEAISAVFSIQTFRPDLEAGSYFVTPDTETLGQWRFASGMSMAYADRPFQIGTGTQELVDYLVTDELFGAVGLTDFFSLGVAASASRLGGSVVNAETDDVSYSPYAALGVGDLWLGGKVQVLDPDKHLFGFAFLPELSYPIPINDSNARVADSTATVRLRSVTELELKPLRAAIQLGYRFRPLATAGGYFMTDTIEYGLGLKVGVASGLDAVLDFNGSLGSPLDNFDGDEGALPKPHPLEVLAGVRGFSGGGLGVAVGGGAGILLDPGAPVFRFFVMIAYRRPPDVDLDRDGLPFRHDRCPTVPENVNGIQDDDGCPEPDSDADTLVDPIDACSTAAEDFDGFKDEDGCPELDNDADGLEDVRDQCPNEAEDKNGIEDGDGCPEIDTDKDGISDRKDSCPNEAEDANGIEDEDGCPEHLSSGRDAAFDTDQDGIEDRADRCPLVPESRDGVQDWDGCPELDQDGDGRPDALDRCPNEAEDKDGFEDDDGCPEPRNAVHHPPSQKDATKLP